MPELIDELTALKKQVTGLDAAIKDLADKAGKHGELTTAAAAKIDALEKKRDELAKDLADLKAAATKTPPAPDPTDPKPKPKTKEDDDGDESGFW